MPDDAKTPFPEAVLRKFAELPLTTRMRAAAEVLDAADTACRDKKILFSLWTPSSLRTTADRWEQAEDDRAAEVEELAALLWRTIGAAGCSDLDWKAVSGEACRHWREGARDLLDAGYRKGDDDE